MNFKRLSFQLCLARGLYLLLRIFVHIPWPNWSGLPLLILYLMAFLASLLCSIEGGQQSFKWDFSSVLMLVVETAVIFFSLVDDILFSGAASSWSYG